MLVCQRDAICARKSSGDEQASFRYQRDFCSCRAELQHLEWRLVVRNSSDKRVRDLCDLILI